MQQINQNFSSVNLNKPATAASASSFSTNSLKSSAPSTSSLERTPHSDEFESSKKDNKKKTLAIAALVVALAGGVALALKRPKSVKLTDLKFEKGVASLSDGKKFSGKVKDTLKNGDKIILEYSDGIIKNSQRSGSKSFKKVFETVNGEKIVKTTIGSKTKEVNLTKIKNEATTAQSELGELLKKHSGLSLEDFQNKTSKIKYKSKAQQQEIDKIINAKKAILNNQTQNNKMGKTLKDITFKNGTAYLNGEPYLGKIYHEMKNGDKVVLQYNSLGKLVRSEVSGTKNIVKEYDNILNTVKITENGTSRNVNIGAIKNNALDALRIQQENTARFNSIMQESDYEKVQAFLNDENNKLSFEKLPDEQLNQVKNLRDKLFERRKYLRIQSNIEAAKITSSRADSLMNDPEFVEKFDDFMNTKYAIPKGKYNSETIETTLDDALKNTVLEIVDEPLGKLYHGTNEYSYDDIIKNGFSQDAVNIAESGKGIYFGVNKAGAESYAGSLGKVVEAEFTGRKVAKVTPGVVGSLQDYQTVFSGAQEKLGLSFGEEDKSLLEELIARRYERQLNDLGIDAVQASSIGAGCNYIAVLNPKNIRILN